MAEWLEHAISVAFRAWVDSDDGFPDGGSGGGLCYTHDDMQYAYRAGYLKRQDEE